MQLSPRNLIRFGSCLVLSVLLLVPAALAQSVSDGTLTGTVTLSTGETIRGVPVRITSTALVARERSAVTDENGRFVFLSLPPGTYTLSALLDGFRPYSTSGVVLRSGDRVDVAVRLEPGAYTEEMVVEGVAPVIDTRSSTIDTTFTNELLDVLPTARNAFYDLALTAPGMSSVGRDESWLSSPSAFGGAANENIFLVNGVNATNPRGAPWGSLVSVNYNTVEEVKILSLGSKAEYGSFSGAAIDVLTKSGGNDFKGDLAYYSQLGNAADNSPCRNVTSGMCRNFGDEDLYADPNDVLTTRPESSREISLTFGGPIFRDRLWFYGGYQDTDSATDTPLFEPLSLWRAKLFDIKLTGEFNPRHRAWFAYHLEDLESGNTTWGQTWDPSMVYNSPTENDTIQAQYQWVVSDRNLFSAKYLGFDTVQNPTIPNENGRPGFINWWKWVGGQSIGLGGDFPYVEAQKSNRQTIQVDHTHYAAQFMGEHEMKFGVQYTRSEGNWQGGYFHGYANFAYPYPWDYGPAENWWWNGPASWQWGTDDDPVFPMYNNKIHRNPWLTVRQAGSTGAFFDDTWSISPRLTFNFGLRYDRMTAKYGEGAVYEMPNRPEDINNPVLLRTREGSDNIFDFKTWSPRLGMAFMLTEDQKTVLRAHAGRYYAPMGVEALRRFGPDMEPALVETWMYYLPMSEVDLNGNGRVDFNEVRPATRLLATRNPDVLFRSAVTDPSWDLEVAPGTTSPYTDQFHISLQRQIGRDFAVEGSYIYKNTQDLIVLRPYNSVTGEYYDWETQPYTTWRDFQTQAWQIALRDYNGDGKIDIEDARFVLNNTGYRAVNFDEFDGQSIERIYHGLQLVMTKRYSNRWQGLASVNWNQSDGVAPRTVSQNWYIDGPMTMDTPFGTTMNHFQNNTTGPLPMTPEWMFKLAGSYTIPVIETNFGLRYRYDSGRPIFPVTSIPGFASWMADLQPGVYLGGGGNMVADDPDAPYWMPSTSIVDVSLNKLFEASGYGVNLSLDVLNAFNESSPSSLGYAQGDFGRVYSIVNPRIYRIGVKLLF
ncbi:MAG TPA: carboxypeptidase regulatory-like domain-containing protein [Thermoanaerobaculia bacterium]|nr:carboxypeptidase regulatory-like domain-containing protein [Thermoanaerobaculia bacterium]